MDFLFVSIMISLFALAFYAGFDLSNKDNPVERPPYFEAGDCTTWLVVEALEQTHCLEYCKDSGYCEKLGYLRGDAELTWIPNGYE